MVSRKAVAALLVVHAAAMLATQTEAFVPIFTYGELQRMQERERNKGQKKSLSIWQRSGEEGPVDPTEPIEEEENKMIKGSRNKILGRLKQTTNKGRCDDPLSRTQRPSGSKPLLTAPVEIGIRMNSRQLEKYRATLEGLLSEKRPQHATK
ncbi:promotilin isoform X1 [Cebus imitator]|uniref:promotilin isoform X1 n=1 Tax=Cebus imitator TaxID=2715852 RepID=UPI001897F480|nr:promotilin isoform X1 [Cebus imitator]XP_037592202.1 promotilin isoform X1 [Cebus imitator]